MLVLTGSQGVCGPVKVKNNCGREERSEVGRQEWWVERCQVMKTLKHTYEEDHV